MYEQGGQGERQLVCIPLLCCPSSFCPKISSLTSVSILLRAGESWQERVALSSVDPIFPVTLYPRHPVRCPESSLGAHCTECGAVHKFLAIPLVFLPFLLHFPLFFRPGTESWCQPHCADPCGRESWWLQPASTFRALLKTAFNYLAYSRHRRE